MASNTQNHQLDQITPIGFKFQGEYLYDRNVWRKIINMNQFNPETQWKFIVDLQITELYDQIPVNDQVLEYLFLKYPCLKNHRHLLELLIQKDIHKILNFNLGLYGACRGGFKDLAQLMIERGAVNWNDGLQGACRGGFKYLAQMMIDRGANDWNEGLWSACYGGHRDLAQWMMDLGARNLDWGLLSACYGGNKDLAQWMIDLGANGWNYGMMYACWGGHRDLAQWMIDLGATDVETFNKYFPPEQ